MTLPFDPNDPRLTAFALGELDDLDQAAVENLLSESDEARRHVESIRATASLLTAHLKTEAAPRLAASQLDAIEDFLPKPAAPRTPFRWRALASAAAVVIAGGGALALWMAQEPLRNQATAPIASSPLAAAPVLRDQGKALGAAPSPTEMPRATAKAPAAPSGRPGVTVYNAANLEAAAPAPPTAPSAAPEGFNDGTSFNMFAQSQRHGEIPRAGTPAPLASAPTGGASPTPMARMMGRGMGGAMGGMGGGMMGGMNPPGAVPSRGRRLAGSNAGPQPGRAGAARTDLALAGKPAGRSLSASGAKPGEMDHFGLYVAPATQPAPNVAAAGPSAKPGQAIPGLVAAGSMRAPAQVPADHLGRSVALGLDAKERANRPIEQKLGDLEASHARFANPKVAAGLSGEKKPKATRERAEAELGQAEVALRFRGAERERIKGLEARRSVDPNLVAKQEKLYESARAEVELKRKAVKDAKPDAAQPADQKTKEVEEQVAQQVEPAQAAEQPPPPAEEPNTNDFDRIVDNPFLESLNNPLSTFSIDVDTASYAIVRHFLTDNQRPPKDAVRIEEMVNYFTYDDPQPTGDDPFSVNIEVARCPWNAGHRLARIGLKGKEIAKDKRPLSNLVFLVDVSGSMGFPNKLPLVKESLRMLTEQLGESDRVAIVVYAAAQGLVLPPTTGDHKDAIVAALDRLEAGGSTNGGAGLQLAYDLAAQHFVKGGTNRVILCTDGDFNVGVTDRGSLIRMVEERAKSGVFLSVMGFGMGNLKDATMEQVADKGNGNYAHIDTIEEGRKVFVEQMTGTLLTIAKDVKIQVDFNPLHVQSYRLVGFENRMLRAEDFRDDAKDAGEIGAGHSVTALYELVPQASEAADGPKLGFGRKPAEKREDAPPADLGSKYVKRVPVGDPESKEWLMVRLRYKAPDGETAKEIERAVTDHGKDYADASVDFKFAAAVAAFGMILRDSPHKGSATLPGVLELAEPGLGPDRSGYRHGFLDLVRKAQTVLPH
jgi:Ca-activated chloride channel family protein